ncbi:MAG: coiled-coil domain-containing protein [Promethearchaeota archaeon]
MVFKNILRIKSALPEVKHVVMFYNNGTVFQTTFEQETNIPKLGENLAEIINHITKLYEICDYNFEKYKKIIFETDDISVIILKLGEESNIALFFKKEEEKELKLTAIKRYMTRIEELVDMDEKELIIQDILTKEEENKHLKEKLQERQKEIEKLGNELKNIEKGIIKGDLEKISKELRDLEIECSNTNNEMEKNSNQIEQLKEIIEQSHKKS